MCIWRTLQSVVCIWWAASFNSLLWLQTSLTYSYILIFLVQHCFYLLLFLFYFDGCRHLLHIQIAWFLLSNIVFISCFVFFFILFWWLQTSFTHSDFLISLVQHCFYLLFLSFQFDGCKHLLHNHISLFFLSDFVLIFCFFHFILMVADIWKGTNKSIT